MEARYPREERDISEPGEANDQVDSLASAYPEATGVPSVNPADGSRDYDDDNPPEGIPTDDYEPPAIRLAPYHKPRPWLDATACYHVPEVMALVDRVKKLHALGIPQASGMLALGEELRDECLAMAASSDTPRPCDGRHSGLEEVTDFATTPEYAALLYDKAIERGKAQRPIPLSGEQEALAQIIDAAAEDTYFTLHRARGGARSEYIRERPGSCTPASFLLQQRLRSIGIESRAMWYHKRPFFNHYSLAVPTGDESLWACPTWQQFLPRDADRQRLPHTLIAPESRITETAASLGVPDKWQSVWTESNEHKPATYRSGSIRSIMDVDGWHDRAAPMHLSVAHALEAARTLEGEIDIRELGFDPQLLARR